MGVGWVSASDNMASITRQGTPCSCLEGGTYTELGLFVKTISSDPSALDRFRVMSETNNTCTTTLVIEYLIDQNYNSTVVSSSSVETCNAGYLLNPPHRHVKVVAAPSRCTFATRREKPLREYHLSTPGRDTNLKLPVYGKPNEIDAIIFTPSGSNIVISYMNDNFRSHELTACVVAAMPRAFSEIEDCAVETNTQRIQQAEQPSASFARSDVTGDSPMISDEDSEDEEEINFDHLSENQLKAVSEARITKVQFFEELTSLKGFPCPKSLGPAPKSINLEPAPESSTSQDKKKKRPITCHSWHTCRRFSTPGLVYYESDDLDHAATEAGSQDVRKAHGDEVRAKTSYAVFAHVDRYLVEGSAAQKHL
uniref:(California timema) hypothetical protein n=1 Tax=Timema californicum TaxID=61474 RepID=A0A7R9JCM1_TIMCA|nr:unnamed protein product [Timema californicum]